MVRRRFRIEKKYPAEVVSMMVSSTLIVVGSPGSRTIRIPSSSITWSRGRRPTPRGRRFADRLVMRKPQVARGDLRFLIR
jgi:hypothetical protein